MPQGTDSTAKIGTAQDMAIQGIAIVLIGDGIFRSSFAVAKRERVELFCLRSDAFCDGSGTFPILFRRFRQYGRFHNQGFFRLPSGNIVRIILHPLQFPDDRAVVFPCQRQFVLLRKFLTQGGFDGFQLGAFLPGVLPLPFYGFVQPFG